MCQAVKVLLLDESDRLLLLRGSEHGQRQFWFPVGGGVEAGEEPGAACLREIAEETG
ncbi:NUDIX domain-containing protein [Dermatophilaceae bacterium Soc4.6]